MTDELTLREKVWWVAYRLASIDPGSCGDDADAALLEIAAILEDTGSPAHMRVAAEFRGE
jgi:hypothetical protein